jgi:serine/threonine protein kinase/TolB-like protein/Tfp pilus assembly protein PilF
MTREEWLHIKDIVAGTMGEQEPARQAYIASRCGSDMTLRSEVESLVESTIRAAQLYETPTLLITGAGVVLDALRETEETSRVGERIGAYRLLRELGGGGMGTAYLAARADDEFQKNVAIKLIKRGMDTDAVLRRFRHERQILADLDHPNIARLLDGGTTADGLPYFVMEYVDGEPIDRYCRERGLPTTERLQIFRHVCDAVQHAHQKQVIHRDLKPSNILVTGEGTPKLLDFGISKALTPDRGSIAEEPTLLARAMTPQFASPEQVRGESVTTASDVYSLGVLLYELLTGSPPYRFDGRTLEEIDDTICRGQVEKPSSIAQRALQRQLSGDLDTIVLKALRKEPERRYATVEQFSEDVRRHLGGLPILARADDLGYRAKKFITRYRVRAIEATLLAAVIAVVAGLALSSRPKDAGTGAGIHSLAIVPFTISGGRTDDVEYLSDGLTEGLIESLSRLPQLEVSARNTVFALKGKAADARAIGRDLNVHTVLLGSLSPVGQRLSLDVELVDSSNGRRLWGSRYVTSLTDLPITRERIVREVAERLHPTLTAVERQQLVTRQTNNGEAYQLYLKGRYVWNKRTEEGFTQGLDYFRQALEKDPQYALAYSGIADCYNLLGIWGALSPHEAMPRVKDAALKAITLDNTLAEAHTSLAFVNWVYDWDWAGADSEFQRALDLNPNYATAHDWYAYYLASMKRFDEAVVHVRRAQEIEPVSLSISTDVGEIYYWQGQYDRAVEQLRGVLQVEPTFAMAHNILGLTYLKMGRVGEAIKELESAERLSTGPRMLSTLGYAYGVSGNRAKARQTLDALQTLAASRYTSSFAVAIAHAGMGEKNEALEQLELALNERSDTMAVLSVYPPLDALRNEPRFRELMKKVGH